MFCYDPFCLYDTETLLSPCMLVSGNKGYGKSAFVKAYLHRQSMAGKWLAILDPKGEYLDLADRDGLSVLGLRPGGPVTAQSPRCRAGPRRRAGPMTSGAGASAWWWPWPSRRSGVPVSSDERSVVTAALMELERRGGRAVPTLRHVMDLLMGPTEAMAAELNTDHRRAGHRRQVGGPGAAPPGRGRPGRHVRRSVHDQVDWSGPGIVIDLSAVLQSPAFSAILVCAGAWLAQVVAAKDRQRIIVVDECWKAIRDAGFVAWGEETQKLSRAYGVQFVTIVQRISDLASQADDGTTTSKRAQGFVTEAETKVTFNLGGGEARASRDVMDWTESEALLVPKLPRGRALWRVGEHGAIVQTILSPRDVAMCDSNQAMRSRP